MSASGNDAGHDLVVLGEHVCDDDVEVREGAVQAEDVVSDSALPYAQGIPAPIGPWLKRSPVMVAMALRSAGRNAAYHRMICGATARVTDAGSC